MWAIDNGGFVVLSKNPQITHLKTGDFISILQSVSRILFPKDAQKENIVVLSEVYTAVAFN